jgi:integrase
VTGRGRPAAPPKKRANGEGSVYPEGNGYAKAGKLPGSSKRTKVRGKTEAEVWAKWHALVAEAERYDLTLPRTIGELAELWLVDYRDTVREGTYTRRAERIRRHIIDDPLMAGIQAADLSPDHVKAWIRAKIADGYEHPNGAADSYSGTYLSDVWSDLSRIIDWAIGREAVGLRRNVVKVAVKPLLMKNPAPKKVKRTLTAEQVRRLLVELAGTTRRYAAIVLIGLYTGARPGEILGLRWTDIHEDTGTITFAQAVETVSGGRPIGLKELKTEHQGGATYRSVRVPASVFHALKLERELQDEMRRDWWPTEWDGLVFRASTGKPPRNVRRDTRRIIEDAGLHEVADLQPYELRHTCGSLLDDSKEVSRSELLDQMGWVNERMFHKRYRHKVRPTTGDSVLRAWDAILGGSDD